MLALSFIQAHGGEVQLSPYAVLFLIYALGVAYLSAYGMSFLAARRCKTGWVRAKGVVKSFTTFYHSPRIAYEFHAGGCVRTGHAITPAVLPRSSILPPWGIRRNWLHPDGRLKFHPGQEVEVLLDPARPERSALTHRLHPGPAAYLIPALIVLNIWAVFHLGWLEENREQLAPLSIYLLGVILILRHVPRVHRAARSRKFHVAKGSLSIGQQNPSTPFLMVEYVVGDILYRSAQIVNMPCWFLDHKSPLLRRLVGRLTEGDHGIDVFYDPKAPWDGFIRQLHPLRVLMPLCIGILLIAVAAGLMWKLS